MEYAHLAAVINAHPTHALEHYLRVNDRVHQTELTRSVTVPAISSNATATEWFVARMATVRRCTQALRLVGMPQDANCQLSARHLFENLPALRCLVLEDVPTWLGVAAFLNQVRSLAVVGAPLVPVKDMHHLQHLTVLHLRRVHLRSNATPPTNLRVVSVVNVDADDADFYVGLSRAKHLRVMMLHRCLERLSIEQECEFANTEFDKCTSLRWISIQNAHDPMVIRDARVELFLQQRFLMYVRMWLRTSRSVDLNVSVEANGHIITNVATDDTFKSRDDDDAHVMSELLRRSESWL